MPELRHRLAVAGLVMLWERGTAAEGAYCVFELTAAQVNDLAAGHIVTLDGPRLGLPLVLLRCGPKGHEQGSGPKRPIGEPEPERREPVPIGDPGLPDLPQAPDDPEDWPDIEVPAIG